MKDYEDDYTDDYSTQGGRKKNRSEDYYDDYGDDSRDDYDDGEYDDNDGYSDAHRRGLRNRDWSDDFDERDNGRVSRSGYAGGANRSRGSSNRYDDDNYDGEASRSPRRRTRNNNDDMEKPEGFRRRHPVLMNLCYIVIAGALLLWMSMWFLDYWTFHGEERVVPDVKGQLYVSAEGSVDLSGLKAVISDSVFDSYSRPGTVVEQTPIPGARIKKGGTVYLTIVAFSPKLITVPDFYNVSVRQARSMFTGLGIKEIREVPVISEYQDLVLGAKFNGVSLQPGARIPVSAIVTLEVGTGWSDPAEESGGDIDTTAIDEAIEELSIE